MSDMPWILSAENGCSFDDSNLPPKTPLGPMTEDGNGVSEGASSLAQLPQVQLYEHIDFGGRSVVTSLNWSWVGDFWNDRISSIVVISGRWRFYEHIHYGGRSWVLGVGYYRWIPQNGIPNDVISSFKAV